MFWLYVLIFIASLGLFTLAGKSLVTSLSGIAEYLGWKEFIIAFFLTAFSVSMPNFFIGIASAINKIPELSLGDIIGGNVIELTLLVAIGGLISKQGLGAQSRTVQGSSLFTIFAAILPLILILDGDLSRIDGILLILAFVAYVLWIFQTKDRFTKVYDEVKGPIGNQVFFKCFLKFLFCTAVLFLAAQGIIKSSLFFSSFFNIPLTMVGVLIISLGNSIPDLAFVVHAAKKSEDWLILGDLMGGTIITATLVLGIVSLICPIQMADPSSMLVGRIFLIISALSFFLFIKTDHEITKTEAFFLLLIYVSFVVTELSLTR
jgi:cation:H+ antiporter